MSYSGRSKTLLGANLAARSQHITIDRLPRAVTACIVPMWKNEIAVRYAPQRIDDILWQPIPPRAGHDIVALKLSGLQAHDIDDRQRSQSGDDHDQPVFRPHFTQYTVFLSQKTPSFPFFSVYQVYHANMNKFSEIVI